MEFCDNCPGYSEEVGVKVMLVGLCGLWRRKEVRGGGDLRSGEQEGQSVVMKSSEKSYFYP